MSVIPPNDATPPSAPTDQSAPAAKPRKRRRWPWVILGLLLALILLVLLAPTIASTGPVRSLVVSKINSNLSGHAQIADWSLGWTTPTDIGGVKVYDANNVLILEVDHLKTDLTLLKALK